MREIEPSKEIPGILDQFFNRFYYSDVGKISQNQEMNQPAFTFLSRFDIHSMRLTQLLLQGNEEIRTRYFVRILKRLTYLFSIFPSPNRNLISYNTESPIPAEIELQSRD